MHQFISALLLCFLAGDSRLQSRFQIRFCGLSAFLVFSVPLGYLLQKQVDFFLMNNLFDKFSLLSVWNRRVNRFCFLWIGSWFWSLHCLQNPKLCVRETSTNHFNKSLPLCSLILLWKIIAFSKADKLVQILISKIYLYFICLFVGFIRLPNSQKATLGNLQFVGA